MDYKYWSILLIISVMLGALFAPFILNKTCDYECGYRAGKYIRNIFTPPKGD